MLKDSHIKCTLKAADTSQKLFPYGLMDPICSIGTFSMDITAGPNTTKAEFVVFKGQGVPLLSRDTGIDLGLITMNSHIAAVSSGDICGNRNIQKSSTVWANCGMYK